MIKIIKLLIVLVVVLSFMIGCTHSNSSTVTNTVSSTLLNVDVSDGVNESAAPMQFESEEDFLKAIKTSSEENNIWGINDITYYYRPKTLPEGAILKYIQVRDTYVLFKYTIDTDKKSTDTTKSMLFMWYRSFDGGRTHPDPQEFIKEMSERRGNSIMSLNGQAEDTTYMADKTFNEGKASIDTMTNPVWRVYWVHNGECFKGNIPYSIQEADIAKYLEMEKVLIE